MRLKIFSHSDSFLTLQPTFAADPIQPTFASDPQLSGGEDAREWQPYKIAKPLLTKRLPKILVNTRQTNLT